MRSLISVGLLAAVPTLFLQSANGAAFHRNSISVSSLSETQPALFGGLSNKISKIPRGGAEEEAAEAPVEELYLPGLLDVELSSSDQVGQRHDFDDIVGPSVILNLLFCLHISQLPIPILL